MAEALVILILPLAFFVYTFFHVLFAFILNFFVPFSEAPTQLAKNQSFLTYLPEIIFKYWFLILPTTFIKFDQIKSLFETSNEIPISKVYNRKFDVMFGACFVSLILLLQLIPIVILFGALFKIQPDLKNYLIYPLMYFLFWRGSRLLKKKI